MGDTPAGVLPHTAGHISKHPQQNPGPRQSGDFVNHIIMFTSKIGRIFISLLNVDSNYPVPQWTQVSDKIRTEKNMG